MRVVALLATFNERRFVEGCIEHLHAQGVETYLIDNDSTDETAALAERHRGRGLIGREDLPRDGVYRWRELLTRKEELAREIDADWFIHLDADEIRLPPAGGGTLAEELERVDRAGYNAVNFMEFAFVPTREAPDHDTPSFRQTLRTYYPFLPVPNHRLNAWKAGPRARLAWSGGHRVDFPGIRPSPSAFPMKHYLYLSIPHAIEKYVHRDYSTEELATGWHGWRGTVTADAIALLPGTADIRTSTGDHDLDASDPRATHWIEDVWSAVRESSASS